MFNPLDGNDSNSYKDPIDAMIDSSTDYTNMPLKELNACVDAELLAMTVSDIMSIPPSLRFAAIADFEEADPALAAKLRLEVLLLSS